MPALTTMDLCQAGTMPRNKAERPPPEGGKQVNFRANAELSARLEAVAEGLGLDLSNLVRMVLNENLTKYERRVEQIRREREQRGEAGDSG